MLSDVNTTVTVRSVVDRASDCQGVDSGHESTPLLALVGWVALSWYAIVMLVSAVGYIQM